MLQDGDIRVDLPNPVYMDAPYTVHNGECMDRGEYIHITPSFLTNINTSSLDNFGPTGTTVYNDNRHNPYERGNPCRSYFRFK